MDALNSRIEIAREAVRNDIKLVLERVDSLGAEVRRQFADGGKEERADRRLIFSMLKDHSTRIRALEPTAGLAPVLRERAGSRNNTETDDRGGTERQCHCRLWIVEVDCVREHQSRAQ